MDAGRYGEAIDLLNKYISANPNRADGFNLRGLCYEKRGNYEYAVYDFRTAKKLDSNDQAINSNHNRVTSNWYKILFNKIEGHKREIAINPNTPKNYLEIGKSYKNLGEWNEAEIWYDIYLEKESASSDEIIRYSEILAKNNHISKGEPILKSYTEKYSDDHRLWSRYGYFTLWLGKNKLAIEAFTRSLDIRPYFKEAMDGLDLAKGKGYIYSINDTTTKFNYGMPGGGKEYEIDRLNRLLKNNSNNDEARYKLVEELIKVNRFEEAAQQLNILSKKNIDEKRYNELLAKTNSLKNSYYSEKIKYYENILSNNPENKKALLELAKYYALISDYELSVNIYKKLILNYPNDAESYYKLTETLMWQNNLCEAADYSNIMVKLDPDNIRYLSLAAKIHDWINELEVAENLYKQIIQKDSSNNDAMFALADILVRKNKFEFAQALLDKLEAVNDYSTEILTLKKKLSLAKEFNKEKEALELLEEARTLSLQKNYSSSIKKFKEYLRENPTNNSASLELADVFIANKQLDSAAILYLGYLKNYGDDYDIQKRLAKVYLWNNDSLLALTEFKILFKKNPQDVETMLLLGDAYLQAGQTENARTIYKELQKRSPDSYIINTRLDWINDNNNFSFSSFPTYVQLIPRVSYFVDNNDFSLSNIGLGFDLGLTNFLAIGLSGSKGKLTSANDNLRFNQIKGSVYFKLNDILSGAAAFGKTNFVNQINENLIEGSLSVSKKNVFNLSAFFNYSDAVLILYSQFLVTERLNAYHTGLVGDYNFKNNLLLSGRYYYIDVSDENYANQFQARLGKKFYNDFSAGYEYYYYNFNRETNLYWSPKNFESHSIWIDWILYKDEVVDFNMAGKLGIIPQSDYLLSEFSASFNYKIVESLFLQSRFTTGSSLRSNTGYRSTSIQGSLIWNL